MLPMIEQNSKKPVDRSMTRPTAAHDHIIILKVEYNEINILKPSVKLQSAILVLSSVSMKWSIINI